MAAFTSRAEIAPAGSEAVDSCAVRYSAFDEDFDARIQVLPALPEARPAGTVDTARSPQGTGTLSVVRPDYMTPGPWHTVLAIEPRRGKQSILQFQRHGNAGVEASWLSEKLVFIRVWWGRIVSSDLVYDAEERRFIYREMAHHSYLLDPRCHEDA